MSEYFEFHRDRIDECVRLIKESGIEDNFEYTCRTTNEEREDFSQEQKEVIRSAPWEVRTRIYPYTDQNITFVGTNPANHESPDNLNGHFKGLSEGAKESLNYFSEFCAEEWIDGWLINGNKAYWYHELLQILSEENILPINETIKSNNDVRGLIKNELSKSIYDCVHFTNWFPLATRESRYIDVFSNPEELATDMLKRELDVVEPSIIFLCSTPAIKRLRLDDLHLHPDEDVYSNPPVNEWQEKQRTDDVVGGMYKSESFPAPAIMLPHPGTKTHPKWDITTDDIHLRVREGLASL